MCARGQERAAELGGTLNPQEAANLLWGLAIMGRAMEVRAPAMAVCNAARSARKAARRGAFCKSETISFLQK